MRPRFLRGRGVDLCPVGPGDELDAAAAPWRLLSRGGLEEPIALAALDPEGKLLGIAQVEAADWVLRDAVLTLRWAGDEAAAAEALRLLVAYAFDELNLEAAEARVHAADGPMRDVLIQAGFGVAAKEGNVERWVRARDAPRATA